MDITKQIELSERKVLSYMFHNKKYIAMTMGMINEEHMPTYNKLYKLLLNYFIKYKDIITDDVLNAFFQKNNIDSKVVVQYKTLINQLKQEIYFNEGEFLSTIDDLIEYEKRKQIFKIAENIINKNPLECSSDEFEKFQDKLKNDVTKATMKVDDIKNEGTIIDSAKERFEKYLEIRDNPEVLKFIPTGFKHIDEENGGFRYGELVYIIGRKGDGKSILMINLAVNMANAGSNVIIFSLEISKTDYERRIDARAAEINSNGLKMGKLSPDDEVRYKEYLKNQSKGLTADGKKMGHIYIVDTAPGITPAQVDSKVDNIEQTTGIKFDAIMTDYAGIMNSTTNNTEKRHQQGQIALDHKIMARQRDCVVISAAQKSRAGAKEKNSDTSFVAESDQVSDHIDWGIDIMSTSDEYGVIQSFKTRDASPFRFSFKKQYNMFKISELEGDADNWDQLL